MRRELYPRLLRYLQEHPCIRCGETDLLMLDFHHRKRTKRLFSVPSGVVNGRPWKTILAEIAKCDVLCIRCHRLATAKDQGWFRYAELSRQQQS